VRELDFAKHFPCQTGVLAQALKAKAYDLLKAAQRFIDKGILQWQ
jgi:hypothetical protein